MVKKGKKKPSPISLTKEEREIIDNAFPSIDIIAVRLDRFVKKVWLKLIAQVLLAVFTFSFSLIFLWTYEMANLTTEAVQYSVSFCTMTSCLGFLWIALMIRKHTIDLSEKEYREFFKKFELQRAFQAVGAMTSICFSSFLFNKTLFFGNEDEEVGTVITLMFFATLIGGISAWKNIVEFIATPSVHKKFDFKEDFLNIFDRKEETEEKKEK